MEFQQLEMFAAVVELESIQRAAERVFRTGSAVSIALKKLEEEVGAPLFTRFDRNHQELTASGELLYSYCTRILHLKREAVAGLEALTKCNAGTVRVGANESTSLYLLPKLTHAFQEVHPGLTLETMCDNSESVITALKNCHIDLALVAFTGPASALKKSLIMRDEIVLIAPPNHHLTRLSKIEIKDLASEVIIAEGAKSSLHEEISQAFQNSGIGLNVRVANVSIEGIKRMVAEGVGIGFVPLMCVEEERARGELLILNVEGVTRERELWLVQRRNESLSPAAQAFLKVSLKAAREWLGTQLTNHAKPNQLARNQSSVPLNSSYC
jgi:DNA-binding transcriptional LysR family regulator